MIKNFNAVRLKMEIRKDRKELHDDTGKDIVIYFFRQILFVRVEFIIKERSFSY